MAVHSQGASVSVGADDVDVDVGVDGVRRASTSIGGAVAGAGDDTAAGVWMTMPVGGEGSGSLHCCCGCCVCALMTLAFQDFSRFAPGARVAIVAESSEGLGQPVVDSSLGSGASGSRAASLAEGESVHEVKSSHIRLSSEGADCLCLRHACVLMLLSVNVFGCVFRLLLLQNQ